MGKDSLLDNKRSISVCINPFLFESSKISLLRPIKDLLSPRSWYSPNAETIASGDKSVQPLSKFLANRYEIPPEDIYFSPFISYSHGFRILLSSSVAISAKEI